MPCKTWTDRGLNICAKGKIFSKHTTCAIHAFDKRQAYSQEINPSYCHKECYIRTMTTKVQLREKILVVSVEELGTNMN
jgi:hypothetical protein